MSQPSAPVVDVADWRDASAYALLAGMDRGGLAWEWLRRDAGYQAASVIDRASVPDRPADDCNISRVPVDEDAPDWGLHFL